MYIVIQKQSITISISSNMTNSSTDIMRKNGINIAIDSTPNIRNNINILLHLRLLPHPLEVARRGRGEPAPQARQYIPRGLALWTPRTGFTQGMRDTSCVLTANTAPCDST